MVWPCVVGVPLRRLSAEYFWVARGALAIMENHPLDAVCYRLLLAGTVSGYADYEICGRIIDYFNSMNVDGVPLSPTFLFTSQCGCFAVELDSQPAEKIR